MAYTSKRHKEIRMEFNKVNLLRKDITKQNIEIGNKLKISSTTVYNYTHGNIVDGYLAEDILNIIKSEIQKEKK